MEYNLRRAAARMMVLLGMLLPAQEAFSQDESLFTSDWRDPATGDWLMGFRPEGVVYDCRVWDYRTKVPEGDGWALLLESGGETLQVKVGREEDGRRSIAVDGRPATVCEKLSGRVMPDYPTADGREIWNRYACHSRDRHKYEINLKSGGGYGNEVSGKRRLHGGAYYEESQDIAV